MEPQPPSAAQRSALERFCRLGLKWNPFRALDRRELPAVFFPPRGLEESPQDLAAWRGAPLQVLGDEGRGKSTFLAWLGARWEEGGERVARFYVEPGVRSLPPIGGEVTAVIADEAQRLGRRALRRLRRLASRGVRLALGSHEDLSRILGPDVRTVRLRPARAEDVIRFFHARIAYAGGDPERIRLEPEAAEAIARRTGGNLRVAELLLYEVFLSLEPRLPAAVGLRAVEDAAKRAASAQVTDSGTGSTSGART